MKVRAVLRRLQEDGWTPKGQVGGHRQFVHSVKPSKVTGNPGDEISGDLRRWTFRQAGWDWTWRQ